MPKVIPEMGTAAWVEHVFSTPPARALKGRTKHTQYHQLSSSHMNHKMGAQGGREASALLALKYLAWIGKIGRFKGQPFMTDKEEFGYEITPDFMFEGPRHGKIYVVEVKTARFITTLVQRQLDYNRDRFREFNISYLAWTDKWPLSLHVRHNLRDMRRAGNTVSESEQNAVVERVAQAGKTTFAELFADGFDRDCILAAAWFGKLFFPVMAQFLPTTVISSAAQDDLFTVLSNSHQAGNSWWQSLSTC